MKIVVRSTDQQWEELASGEPRLECVRIMEIKELELHPGAAAFFDLENSAVSSDHSACDMPVFINSVTLTLKELKKAGNVFRINGWTGFLKRPVWEIAGTVNEKVNLVVEVLQKKLVPVQDEPGLITAKVLSMIINEAYFALGEGVSSKPEIDTAMKLGTNYPFGPFEWASIIGIKNIHELLASLSTRDKRYLPSPELVKAAE